MSDEPVTAPASEDLDDLFVGVKFAVPRHRAPDVSRAALIDAARASGRRVVGVTAPPGYGKSTLLAEWARTDPRTVVWITLDRFDDAPRALLSVLASALARHGIGLPGLGTDMVGPDASLLGRAAPRLASVLRTSPVPFVLVLDDLHEVRSAACHDVLGIVVGGIPDGSQLVAASRDEQPHLARLRATDGTVEVGVRELALDAEGTAQVFAAAGVPLTPHVADAVRARTEGWPVGVHLAALVARDGGDGADVAAVTGTDRYVADYLQRETLRRLPGETRQFLRRTAVLDDLTAPLCDAVLGEASSLRHLRELESAHLFLVPLDRHRRWFRYHALFRELLLDDLLTTEPDLADDLRVKAADWYEANGSPERAVEQLLATGERERAARLVTRIVMSLFQAGQISTIDRWLGILGDEAIRRHPPLAVLAGFVAVYEGRAGVAERWGAVADAATFDGIPGDGSASFDSARAMYRALRCPDGPQRMLDDAHLALAAEPEWSSWRDTALVLSGDALRLIGDDESAVRHLELGVEAASALGDADTLVYAGAQLADLDMDRGRWENARLRVQRVLAAIGGHRMDDYPTSALGYAVAARLAHHDHDLALTDDLLTRGMRTRTYCTYAFPTLAVRVRLRLARTSWATADVAAVRHLLREIDDVLLRRPALGVLTDEAADLRKSFDAAEHASTVAGHGPPLTPAELRLLPYLQTHLTIREIGERLFVSRNTASSEIGSIYRKLGVSSRSEAVERALARGLLGA
ncbi:LuxR C-terminal-related transcriptional regulator [Oerskovia sp. NPDC056781]|uniref:LuxR C-terminal-related transcriptional regulator n=1 Tax=Oerskovia sp. NPDC056781 TaxID=3345942 RepID=UPI00366BAB9C